VRTVLDRKPLPLNARHGWSSLVKPMLTNQPVATPKSVGRPSSAYGHSAVIPGKSW